MAWSVGNAGTDETISNIIQVTRNLTYGIFKRAGCGTVRHGEITGRNSTGSLYIDGNVIYSYGRHFPVAKRVADGIIITGDRYSVTTAKHIGQVYYACVLEYGTKRVVSLPKGQSITV